MFCRKFFLSGYQWQENIFSYNPISIFFLASLLGVVGGAYGIGGGSLLAPILVSVFKLPIHTIAGATLASTFIASIAGIFPYAFLGPLLGEPGLSALPEWTLGGVLGLGGFAGIYLGARLQKRVSTVWIEIMLALIILYVAGKYTVPYFVQ